MKLSLSVTVGFYFSSNLSLQPTKQFFTHRNALQSRVEVASIQTENEHLCCFS